MRLKNFVKKRSLFFEIFFFLLLLSIATVAAVVIFINILVVKEQNKNIQQLQQRQLVYASTLMDLRLEEMEHNAVSFLQNDDMISAMVVSKNTDADTKVRILSLLENQCNENEATNNALFYMPYAELIYYSDGNIISFDYSQDQDLINQYIAHFEDSEISLDDVRQELIRLDGDLYLVTSYAVPNLIGILFYEIDTEVLCSFVQADDETEDIFIYDNYSGTWLYSDPEASLLEEWEAGEYESYYSEELDWTYVCFASTSAEHTTFFYIMQLAAPFLLIYLILSIFITLKITQTVYRPINRLLALSASDETSDASRDTMNETDYLEQMYSGTLTQNQNQRELLSGISEEIMQQMYQEIIFGTYSDEQQVYRTLDAMGRTDLQQSQFRILIVEFRKIEGEPPTPLEYGLYRRSLKHMVEGRPMVEYEIWILFTEEEKGCLIVSFGLNETEADSKMVDLGNYLRKSTEGLPYELMITMSQRDCSLFKLGEAYRELLMRITEEKKDEEQVLTVQFDWNSTQTYYNAKSVQAIQIAEEQDWREASKMMAPIFQDIREMDPLTQDRIYETLWTPLEDRLHQYGLSDLAIEERSKDISLVPEEEDPRKTAYDRLLAFAQLCNQNKKYRYVREAVNYISEHYQDGSLSLGEVSQAIGISQTYFSEICSEIMNCGFSTYLNCYRVERAKEFLKNTSDTAKSIGITCGFNSAQNFTRVFKKITGMTPGQYRESVLRGKDTE